MADKLIGKLQKLCRSAQEKGNFVVDAAAARLIDDPDSMDRRINLIGALHEVGSLRQVLSPYWSEFRRDEAAWASRCISRLLAHDHDYWAVAALLGLCGQIAVEQARQAGFALLAVRKYSRYDLPDVHVTSMAITHDRGLLIPLLELGWDVRSNELVDCARARAVMLGTETRLHGALVADGDMSYFCRATLPHGAWRSVSLPFAIPAEAIVAEADIGAER